MTNLLFEHKIAYEIVITHKVIHEENDPAQNILISNVSPSETRFKNHDIPKTLGDRFVKHNMLNALLVLENYQHLGTPDGEPVTPKQLQGILTDRALNSGIDDLITVGWVNLLQNETRTSVIDKVVFQNVANSKTRGSARLLVFRPLVEALALAKEFFHNRAIEKRHADIPADVQPDFAYPDALTADECAALDTARAAEYAVSEPERLDAHEALSRDLIYLERDFERIRKGTYQPYDMPPDCRNATDLWQAIAEREMDDHPEGIEGYKLRNKTGKSRATMSRWRKKVNSIAIPQYEDIPITATSAAKLGQRQHAELIAPDNTVLVIEGNDHLHAPETQAFINRYGGATLRKMKPALEKYRANASEQECAAYDDYSRIQRGRGQAARLVADTADRALLPTGYSTAWLIKQLNYTPGAKELPRFDPETGEVYTPGELWHILADRTVQTVEQGEVMTLTTYSAEAYEDRTDEQKTTVTDAETTAEKRENVSTDSGRSVCDQANKRPDRPGYANPGSRSSSLDGVSTRQGETGSDSATGKREAELIQPALVSTQVDKRTARRPMQRPPQKPDPARRLFFYPDYQPGDLVYIDGLPYTPAQAARHDERLAQYVTAGD